MAKIDLRSWGLVGVVTGDEKEAKKAVTKREKSNPEYEYVIVSTETSYMIYGRLKKAVYANTIK